MKKTARLDTHLRGWCAQQREVLARATPIHLRKSFDLLDYKVTC